MEAIVALLGVADVALRTSSKLWQLSVSWRDAPADLHRLRDELVRTERFFAGTQEGINSLYKISRGVGRDTHKSWQELEQLLNTGITVLRQIEGFVDSVEKGSSSQVSSKIQSLGKSRKVIWMTNARRTSQLRAELQGIVAHVSQVLVAQNIFMSAESYTSLKQSNDYLGHQLERHIRESQDTAVLRLDYAIAKSQQSIISRIDQLSPLTSPKPTSPKYRQHGYRQEPTCTYSRQAPGGNPWRVSRSDINCRCRCHDPQSSAYRLSTFQPLLGSIFLTYRTPDSRLPCTRTTCGTTTQCSRRGFPSREIRILYTLPDWLARSFLVAALSFSSPKNGPHPTGIGNLSFNLQIYNRQPDDKLRGSDTFIGCAWQNDIEAVKLLLKSRSPSFYDTNIYGQSALAYAVGYGRPGIVKLLLHAGMDPYQESTVPGGMGTAPIGMAFRNYLAASATKPSQSSIYNTDREIAEMFDLEEFIDEAEFTSLHKAVLAAAKQEMDLERLFHHRQGEYKKDVNSITLNGLTALNMAIVRGDLSAVPAILSLGADPNFTSDTSMRSPLFWTCWYGHYSIAKVLLSSGADLTARNFVGWTPLHAAVHSVGGKGGGENPELVALLLEHGADPTTKDEEGDGPFPLAVFSNRLRTAKLLLDYGADVNALWNFKRPLLHEFIIQVNDRGSLEEGVDFLMANGYIIEEIEEGSGWGILHVLAGHGTLECIKVLTKVRGNLGGLDLMARTKTGETALEILEKRFAVGDKAVSGDLEAMEVRNAFDGFLERIERDRMNAMVGFDDGGSSQSDKPRYNALSASYARSKREGGDGEGEEEFFDAQEWIVVMEE